MHVPLELVRNPKRLAALRVSALHEQAIGDTCERYARIARALFEVSAVVISLIEEDRFIFKSALGAELAGGSERPLHLGFCHQVLAHPEGLRIEDAAAEPALRDIAATRELGIRGYLGLPLVVSEQPIGALALIERRPRAFSDEEVARARDLAGCIAGELELRVALHGRKQARTEGEILYGLTAAISRGEPLEGVYEHAFDALADVLQAERASVLLFGDDDAMHFQGWRGLSPEYRAAVDGHSPWKRGDKNARPLLVPDVEHDPAWAAYLPVFRGEGIRALGFLPIAFRDELLGKFMVYYPEPHVFSEREVQVAQAISAHIATTIARTRSDAEREHGRRRALLAQARATALQEITAAFSNAGSPAEVIDVVLTRGLSVLGAHAGSVLTLNAADDALELAKAIGYPEQVLQVYSRIPLTAPLPLAEAARSREPAFIDTLEELTRRFGHSMLLRTAQSGRWAAIPLEAAGQVIGALGLSLPGGSAFDPDDRAFITALAQQCAQAFERKRIEGEAKRAHRAIREAQERIRLALDAAAVGTWDYDPSTKTVFWDERCTAIFGLDASRGIDHIACRAVFHPDDRARVEQEAARALDPAGDGRFSIEFRGVAAPGSPERWVAAKGQVLFDADGRALRFIGTVSDISEAKRAALERERMIEELNRTLRFSEVLTGVLAHDLRNPLDAITMTAGTLLRHEGAERMAKPLSRLLGSAERMARMIDQLLDFTHVRLGGGIPLQRTLLDLGELCHSVVDELENVYPERKLRLELRGDLSGRWDRDRLAQLLSNLGGNACQHGDERGAVLVRVSGEDAWVELSVCNQGTIAPELLPSIFEPLRSGGGGERSSGLGLGLYITQQITLAHGGSIHVHSAETDGTRFIVRLPRVG